MIAKSIAMGLALMLVACSRDDPPSPATQTLPTPAAAETKPEATAQKPVAPAPVVQYFEKADVIAEPYRPDLTVGYCLPVTADTQFKKYNATNKQSSARGAGLSPFGVLNNYFNNVGLDRVDETSGRIRVIRLPTHGKMTRHDSTNDASYIPDADYLGDDRLVLAAEVGGKTYEVRYYLHTIENYYGAQFQEPCRQSTWKIGPGPPNKFEPPAIKGDADAFHLGACRFVYTNDSAGEAIQNGLSAALAVMARQQALLREWNDDLWKVRVITPPQHGTLESDTTLEASYVYWAKPGFTGLDRIIFEVSLGAENYQVEQLVLVNSFDPDFLQNVPSAAQSCEALRLPGIPDIERED